MQARSSTAPAMRRAVARAALAAALWVGIGAAPLAAQYTSPGSVATTNKIPTEAQFDESLREARWQLGPVRLVPWVGLRDASFVSTENQQAESEDDFTLTVGAGLRAYLPTGKVIWTAQVLPEYVWWQDNEDKRNFNGRFGLGLFGHFNRLRLQVSQRRVEQQSFFSDEVRELTSSRSDLTNLVLEVDAARRLVIYGAARLADIENEEVENPTFSLLDREEESFEIGLRYLSPKGLSLSLGFEDTSSEFDENARDLSNSGDSGRVEVGYEGGRFDVRLALEFRDLEADEGSEFGTFDETTGSFEVAWTVAPRLDLLTYARREQRFSVNANNSFSLYERQGVRLDVDLGKSSLGLIGEIGEDEFTTVSTGEVGRIDDVFAYGADYRVGFELVTLTARFLLTDYDSNFDQFDREISTFGFAVELGGLVEKLQLGRPTSDW